MITEFNKNLNRKARLWIDEFPPISYETKENLFADVVTNNISNYPSKVCFEVFVSRGTRNLYGLIGAEFKPISNEILKLQVGISEKFVNLHFYENPISGMLKDIDVVKIGLPEDFGVAVLNGLTEEINQLKEIPSGIVNVSCAAFAEISSSQSFFYSLSKIIPYLLFDRKDLEKSISEFLDKLC